MPPENVAAAKRIYEARNRGDVDAVLAECDPQVEWHPHLATLSRQPIRGHDGVREYMASLQEDWESFRHKPEQFFDAGEKVVVFLHTYARGSATAPTSKSPSLMCSPSSGGSASGVRELSSTTGRRH